MSPRSRDLKNGAVSSAISSFQRSKAYSHVVRLLIARTEVEPLEASMEYVHNWRAVLAHSRALTHRARTTSTGTPAPRARYRRGRREMSSAGGLRDNFDNNPIVGYSRQRATSRTWAYLRRALNWDGGVHRQGHAAECGCLVVR